MDTSRLNQIAIEISEHLRPYLDYLPFKRLGEQLNEFTLVHEGRSLYFRTYSVSAPLGMTHENRVHAIPIFGNLLFTSNGKLNGYSMAQILIFKQGGGGSHLSWYFHKAKFVFARNSYSYFESHKSIIEPLAHPSDWENKKMPDGFERKVRFEMTRWIQEAIGSRMNIIHKLEQARDELSPYKFIP